MEAETLVKLIDAGFTKSEIMNLIGSSTPAPASSAVPAAQEETKPEEPKPAAEPVAPEKDNGSSEIGKRLDGIENSLTDMMKRFQAENLKRDSFDHPPAESLESQTDRIMASIIRPEKGCV